MSGRAGEGSASLAGVRSNGNAGGRLRDALRRRADALRPHMPWRARRLLAGCSLAPGERALARRVKRSVSYRDGMHRGAGEHYFRAGLSALRCIEEALGVAGTPPVRRVLDLPCGHGRVLRWLAARFPHASLTASDIDADGVQWCARAFGATPAYSLDDFDQLSLGQDFDLIWCGSLATHLDEASIAALLRFFARHLSPGGLLVLTTHGDRAAQRMRDAELDYLLDRAAMDRLLASHLQAGFAYADYPGQVGYGLSLTSREWLAQRARAARLGEVSFQPAGWDDHQDVIGLVPA